MELAKHATGLYRGKCQTGANASARGLFVSFGATFQYQNDMDRTMAYFSAHLMGRRNGVINLAGPYTDWIWEMSKASQGYFMCWVEDHAMALAMHMIGCNGYMVKFFDPNNGECKFKKPGDFKQFVGRISYGFCKMYHQTRLDYRMFS